MKTINPNIEILGHYATSKSKILCKCKIDGYRWSPTASSLMSGFGCPKCSGNKKKTHEEFVEELKSINQNIIVVGKYINSSTKILFKCKIDGFEWYARPSNLIQKHYGCPQCARLKTSERMSLTDENFQDKLKKYNEINNTFWKTEDIYKNSTTVMEFKCERDGYTINAKSSNLFSGYYRCHECDREKKRLLLINHIKENNLPIEVIGEYIDTSTDIKCKCTLCNREYNVTPNRILERNAICRKCAYTKMSINSRVSIDEFLSRLEARNPTIKYIDGYISISDHVNVECKKCGYKWSPRAGNIVNYYKGCPNCNLSKGEQKIKDILNKFNIDYITQKTFDNLVGVGGLKIRYDFYLPSYNVLIEYQGIQHEIPVDYGGKGEEFALNKFKKQQIHDNRKRQYAKENNIKLLEIWYCDFENIEKIIHDFLFKQEV